MKGGQIYPPPPPDKVTPSPEKTTCKKPSFIRAKEISTGISEIMIKV